MESELAAIFQGLGCDASVCAQAGPRGVEVALGADVPVPAASLIKILVAVETERQLADGRLDPGERVRLPSGFRTPGPVGFSLYDHDVEVALADLVVPMLTISDNVAADALLARVGVAACNQTAADLGMTGTVLVSDLATMIDGLAVAAGFTDFPALRAWASGSHPEPERLEVERRIRQAPQLDPGTATRTTARDMCRLLHAVWTDEAAPAEGCARIRGLMRAQLTRHRLATGFAPPARVAAKSGGLFGVLRHEAGVIESGAHWWPVAVLTTARTLTPDGAAIDTAIGQAAAQAVGALTTS